MRVLFFLAVLAGGLSMLATADPPSDERCLSDVGRDGGLLFHVRELVSESPALPLAHDTRVGDSLPLLTPSEVQVVDDEAICRAAVNAVNAAPAASSGEAYVTTKVLVLRAGSVYVVQDPERKAGEWCPAYVFNRTFGRLLHVFLH